MTDTCLLPMYLHTSLKPYPQRQYYRTPSIPTCHLNNNIKSNNKIQHLAQLSRTGRWQWNTLVRQCWPKVTMQNFGGISNSGPFLKHFVKKDTKMVG